MGYGGSFCTTAGLTFLLPAGFTVSCNTKSSELRSLILGGVVMACGFWVRQLDAFCVWLAMLAGTLLIARRRKTGYLDIALFSAMGFLGLALLFRYNYWLVHCLCIAKYQIWNWQFKITDPEGKKSASEGFS